MLAGARDECVTTSCVRTTTNRRLPDRIPTVDRHDLLGEPALALSGDERQELALRHLEMLPAEQTCIDGPGTRSDHRQGGAQRCQEGRTPNIGTGIRHPYLHGCDQRSTDRSP